MKRESNDERIATGYLPKTTKSITPQVMALFTGKSEKVVGDDRLQKRNQFKILLKNNIQKKKR